MEGQVTKISHSLNVDECDDCIFRTQILMFDVHIRNMKAVRAITFINKKENADKDVDHTWPQSKMNRIKSKISAWFITTRSEATYDDELTILSVRQSFLRWDSSTLWYSTVATLFRPKIGFNN